MFEIVSPALAGEARLVVVVVALAAEIVADILGQVLRLQVNAGVESGLKVAALAEVLVPEVVDPFPVLAASASESEVVGDRQSLTRSILIQSFRIVATLKQFPQLFGFIISNYKGQFNGQLRVIMIS